jgi:DNA-binding NarL/FixJ family response regulator
MAVQVLLIDDTADMRALTRTILELEDDITVVGETGEPYDALELWRTLRPHVVVLDEQMPGLTGLQVAERILFDDPAQPIVLFTAVAGDDIVRRAEEVGVCRVLTKDRHRELVETVRDCSASLI